MSYLQRAKEAEARLRREGKMRSEGTAHSQQVADPDLEGRLARAYRDFWRLGEGDPLDAYYSALAEIRTAEAGLPEAQIRMILKEASEGWYQEVGRCPFCGDPTLHSPAEAIVEAAV